MKLIFIFLMCGLFAYTACKKSYPDISGRYESFDKKTVLILLPNGDAQVEEVGPPRITFQMGSWYQSSASEVTIAAIGEKLRLQLVVSRKHKALKAVNPDQCPDVIAAWRISGVFEQMSDPNR